MKIHHLEYTDGGILDPDDVLADVVEDKDKVGESKIVLHFPLLSSIFSVIEFLHKLMCQLLLKDTICSGFTWTAHKSKFFIRCLPKVCQSLGTCLWWPN